MHEERLRQVRLAMRSLGVDALFVTPSTNLFYLTGFSTSMGERLLVFVVPSDGNPVFVVPAMYDDHVRGWGWRGSIVSWRDGQDPWKLISEVFKEMGLEGGVIAVEDSMPSFFLVPFKKRFRNAEVRLVSQLLTPMRMVKSTEEIRFMKKAARISDEAFERSLPEFDAGMEEKEWASIVEKHMRDLGGDGPAFETIVASGANSALPHHTTGDRTIGRGDVVTVDFGCLASHYRSDMTRVVCVGKTPRKARQLYSIVSRAQAQAKKVVREGIAAGDVDDAARSVIVREGFGDCFAHRTGHGIGLDVHEPPYLTKGEKTKLCDGMTFTVEPGIYIPGRFGVRVEDTVLLESTCVDLTVSGRRMVMVQ